MHPIAMPIIIGSFILGIAIVISQGFYEIKHTHHTVVTKVNKLTGTVTVCLPQNKKLVCVEPKTLEQRQ